MAQHPHGTPKESTSMTDLSSRAFKKSIDLSSKSRHPDVLARYDTKLEEISKGYLAFFEERVRIESQYTDSLQNLYIKTRAFDSLYDDAIPGHLPQSRSVWREVRDHTEREVESRHAYIGALEETVLRTLQEVRERQTKIKLRIKEDLKKAEARYRESAENTVPKLKKAYFRKCQELEEQKRQDQAIALQAKLLSEPMNPGQSYSPLGSSAAETPFHPYTSPPTSNPPLPPSSNPALVQLDLGDGGKNEAGSRKRSGSVGQDKAKEVLTDLAVQGKKQISAFMSRFGNDKDRSTSHSGPGSEDDSPPIRSAPLPGHNRGAMMGSSISSLAGVHGKDGLASGWENPGQAKASALKTSKLRREADEADKAYRTAVFDLESHRLNINKIVMHANETLSDFAGDFAEQFAKLLTHYMDATIATSSMNAQSGEFSRKVIRQIVPSAEAEYYSPPHSPGAFAIPQILYENYYVGPCHSLIFGVALTAYDYQRGEKGVRGSPPTIVLKCIAELDRRGLDQEGIHRISGRQSTIHALVQDIELDEEAFSFSEKEHDVFSISSVLKQYCRELPEPIFPVPQHERVRYTENRELHISSNFSAIRAKLAKLPPIHQSTFRAILEHLSRVASNASQNKMNAKNLAVIWATALFGDDELPKDGDLASFRPGKDTLAEDLITFVSLLFGELDSHGPVLPPHAALTRAGSMSYDAQSERAGSSHTKTRLGAISGSDKSHIPTSPPSMPPRLPPRPTGERTSSTDSASPMSAATAVSAQLADAEPSDAQAARVSLEPDLASNNEAPVNRLVESGEGDDKEAKKERPVLEVSTASDTKPTESMNTAVEYLDAKASTP